MLNRAVRLLIALTLALAIPIQGLAAMNAGLCMALGEHQTIADSAYDHAAPHHEQDSTSSQHSHSDGDAASHAHCGPCVACCAAATISAPVHVYPPEPPAAAPLAALSLAPAGVLPEQLDRPPLTL